MSAIGEVPYRIVLCRGPDWSSKLIGWSGGGYWSHYATLLPSTPHGGPDPELPPWSYVLDARADHVAGKPPGVEIRAFTYLNTDERLILEKMVTQAQAAEAVRLLYSQLHKPYDVTAIVDFIDGRLADHNWQDQSAWICDELGLWAEQGSGIIPLLPQATFRITPGGALLNNSGAGFKPIAHLQPGDVWTPPSTS